MVFLTSLKQSLIEPNNYYKFVRIDHSSGKNR